MITAFRPLGAFGQDRFQFAEQPYVHVEIRQLDGRDRRKTPILFGDGNGRVFDGLEKRHRLSEGTATTPQHARSLQRHECAGHRHLRKTGQRLLERIGDLAENRGNQPAARGLEDQALLIRGQGEILDIGLLAGSRGSRRVAWLGLHLVLRRLGDGRQLAFRPGICRDAHRQAARAPVARAVAEAAGNRRAAAAATILLQAVDAQTVTVASDKHLPAAGAIGALPAVIAHISRINIVQPGEPGNLVGLHQGGRRRGRDVFHAEIGMKGREVQRHVGPQGLDEPRGTCVSILPRSRSSRE